MSVKISGVREISAALHQLAGQVAERKLVEKGLRAGATIVRDDARVRAPLLAVPHPHRIRGTLQRSIIVSRGRPEGRNPVMLVRVRPLSRSQIAKFKRAGGSSRENPRDPFYWRFVEFGTSRMAARPFLRPAFESGKLRAVDAALGELRVLVGAELAKRGRRFPA